MCGPTSTTGEVLRAIYHFITGDPESACVVPGALERQALGSRVGETSFLTVNSSNKIAPILRGLIASYQQDIAYPITVAILNIGPLTVKTFLYCEPSP